MPKPSSQAEIINVLNSNQEKEDDDGKEDVLADVSEQQRGRGWCAAKFFQHFPASPDI